MNVRNCRKCGRLFNYITGMPICQACKEAEEAKFQTVKEFVRGEGRNATIPEISEACEVDPGQIRQWIREERLTFDENSPMGIECESCGTTIKTGRFCEKCKNDIARGLIDAAGLNKKNEDDGQAARRAAREAARMRFLDKK